MIIVLIWYCKDREKQSLKRQREVSSNDSDTFLMETSELMFEKCDVKGFCLKVISYFSLNNKLDDCG